jgi:hypothetical protein
MAPRRLVLTAAALLVTGSLIAPTAADAAKRRSARFAVVELKGEQKATWQQVSRYSQACQGEIHESGAQTIAFVSTGKAKLKIKRIGHGRFKSSYGTTNVPTGWTFTRTYDRSQTANTCPPSPYAGAAQSYDCGTQGPFPVPMGLSYRGTVELSAVLNGVNGKGPNYRTCAYEGYHEQDILDAEGKLSSKKVWGRKRKTFHVHLAAHRDESLADGAGSQSTTLTADVTLKRTR